MFDSETWKFINTFAPWLAAIGTLVAARTALKLARRETSMLVRMSCKLQLADLTGDTVQTIASEAVQDGRLGPDYGYESANLTEIVSFDIVNVGHRPVAVNSVYWKLKVPWKSVYLDFFFEEISSAIPEELKEYGKKASYRMTLEQFESFLPGRIVQNYTRRMEQRIVAGSVRAGCKTTVGENFEVKIDRALRQRLADKLGEAPRLRTREPRVSD